MLDGFRVSGYRSFGGDGITVNDLAKINIFAGKNNCGKSNILSCVRTLAQLMRARAMGDKNPVKLQPLDYCVGGGRKVSLGIQFERLAGLVASL